MSCSPASSRKSSACSRVTEGAPSRKSSMVSPCLRWSRSICTGTRAPAKHGAPLIRSGLIHTTLLSFALCFAVTIPRYGISANHARHESIAWPVRAGCKVRIREEELCECLPFFDFGRITSPCLRPGAEPAQTLRPARPCQRLLWTTRAQRARSLESQVR